MLSLVCYIFIICFSMFLLCLYGYANKTNYCKKNSFYNSPVEFFFSLLPIIFLTGLRYGIGTDYFSYKSIYNSLHEVSFSKYLENHFDGVGEYYVEIGWYILNRFFSFNFPSLLFIVQIIIFSFLYKGLAFFKGNVSVPLAIMIYCFTQLVYSWNGMRFAIAVVIVFSGFKYIVHRSFIKWVAIVLLAMTFHKTSIVCLPFYFMAEFNSKKFNKARNFLLFLFVVFFPVLINSILDIVALIPFFSRYFAAAAYIIGDFHFSPMFLFHIVPVILPILVVRGKFIKQDSVAKVLFRIYLLEIPFREIGMVNTWFTRFARFPQMVEIVLIPYVLYSLSKGQKKLFMQIYYFYWYVFYFLYYAIINDRGDSYPYQSILNF